MELIKLIFFKIIPKVVATRYFISEFADKFPRDNFWTKCIFYPIESILSIFKIIICIFILYN